MKPLGSATTVRFERNKSILRLASPNGSESSSAPRFMVLPPYSTHLPSPDTYPASHEYALRTQYLVRQLAVRLQTLIDERRAAERDGATYTDDEHPLERTSRDLEARVGFPPHSGLVMSPLGPRG